MLPLAKPYYPATRNTCSACRYRTPASFRHFGFCASICANNRPESSTPRSYMPDTAAVPASLPAPPCNGNQRRTKHRLETPPPHLAPARRGNMNHRTARQRVMQAGFVVASAVTHRSGYAYLIPAVVQFRRDRERARRALDSLPNPHWLPCADAAANRCRSP